MEDMQTLLLLSLSLGGQLFGIPRRMTLSASSATGSKIVIRDIPVSFLLRLRGVQSASLKLDIEASGEHQTSVLSRQKRFRRIPYATLR